MDSVSKIVKLCDYVAAKKSKFIAYTSSFIFVGCIAFHSIAKQLVVGKVLPLYAYNLHSYFIENKL